MRRRQLRLLREEKEEEQLSTRLPFVLLSAADAPLLSRRLVSFLLPALVGAQPSSGSEGVAVGLAAAHQAETE